MTLGAILFYSVLAVWFLVLGLLTARRAWLKRVVGTTEAIEKARQLAFIQFLCVTIPIAVGGIVLTILS